MANDANVFDNDAETIRFFLNFFYKNSEDEIDFDESDIIDLIKLWFSSF